jgi:transposase
MYFCNISLTALSASRLYVAMYIETVPNRNSPPCILLRESFRQDGKVKHRTLANLTSWPKHLIDGLRLLLKGPQPPVLVGPINPQQSFQITRSLPHGHVEAVLKCMRKLGLDRLLGSKASAERNLVLAMIAARILDPSSKLATARALDGETLSSTLAAECQLEAQIDEDDLYAAMDWLLERQGRLEKALARRHLAEGSLVLYDLTSSYLEGVTCPLGRLGHNRDGKKGKLRIEYGLLCNQEGCPVAVEVFEGNTADPMTLGVQIDKLRRRFGLKRLVLVGDRGMITQARIEEELRPVEGLDWITALRSTQIAQLLEEGALAESLFDQRNLAEIHSPEFPGERLVACRNPLLAEHRHATRQSLLAATEKQLAQIAAAVQRPARALRGKAKIALRAGRILNRYKMAKHFILEIEDRAFGWRRDEQKIAAEAALDGIYVVRTSVAQSALSASQVVERYKDLGAVEQAFRCLKTVDLKVRPIHHRLEGRVRAHVFLCMLAYYVEWHLRQALAPMLFEDDAPRLPRLDPVSQKKPSASAARKARTKKTAEGAPVHSFQTLLADLATITRNTITPNLPGAPSWSQQTEPTALQRRALELIANIPSP